MLKHLPSHAVVGLLWLFHWLPLSVLSIIGGGFGMMLYTVAAQRRHVAKVNLRLCFPELDETARNRLARAHFRLLGRSVLERGILWWASPARLRRLIRVEGEERLRALHDAGRPVILMAPHFLGLDAGGTGIVSRFDIVSIFARQKNPVIDRWLYHGRSRFGDQKLLSRNEGVRATVKAMKSGRPFYYLPDMNYRTRDAIFVPFFGVPAWTITGLSRLSRVAGATVISCVTRVLPGGRGYVVELGDPWPDFPTDDIVADTARMNREIEAQVRKAPEQYYWVHRRFKTRPPGEARPY